MELVYAVPGLLFLLWAGHGLDKRLESWRAAIDLREKILRHPITAVHDFCLGEQGAPLRSGRFAIQIIFGRSLKDMERKDVCAGSPDLLEPYRWISIVRTSGRKRTILMSFKIEPPRDRDW